jgi:hypothetical protein
MGWMARL